MMASYNRQEFIKEAIESVQVQTYANWELLVLDDASTDQSPNIIRELEAQDSRIRLVPSDTNLGITRNRNRGFIIAKGDYIAVLDNDDYWLNKDKLAKQVEFLETNPDYVLVGTNVAIVEDHSEPVVKFSYQTEDTAIRKKILARNQFTHSSILMRRGALPSEKPYDETGLVSIWEDYDLFLRLGQRGKLANLSEVMTAYRLHSGNITKAKKKEGAKTHLKIIKKYQSSYPNYHLALIKGWLRYLLALIGY